MDNIIKLLPDAEIVSKDSPFSLWELIEVVFPSTANVDVDVAYTIKPPTPTQIGYMVLRQSGPGVIYQDYTTVNTSQYFRLRSNIG